MKLKIISLTVCILLSVTTLFAQSDNGWIHRARGAAHNCLSNFVDNHWRVSANVYDVYLGPNFGTVKEIVFIGVPDYDPDNHNHPPPLPIVIARVRYNSCRHLISVECY